MNDTTSKMTEANESGYDAAMNNMPRERNPHAEGSDPYRAWEAGWLQGRSDAYDMEH